MSLHTCGFLDCRGTRIRNDPTTWEGRGDRTKIRSASMIASCTLCVTIRTVVGCSDQI